MKLSHLRHYLSSLLIVVIGSSCAGCHHNASNSTPTSDISPTGLPANKKTDSTPILSGIDVLIGQNFDSIRGKRVGLVTNQTGITRDGRSTIDVLARTAGFRLVALYSPEHGLRGQIAAGQQIENGRDSLTGLPVYSLYGNQRPSVKMLRGVQLLIFDLQDIGSRSYTYISTLGDCMAACADAGIPLIVLDRPNLLGGDRIEGNIPSAAFYSSVCRYAIPYCHGLTMGELAQMINARGWLKGGKRCSLTVIPMQGYRRAMSANETGLPWVPTSPNIPHSNTALFYAATGIIGELPSVSVGIGTPMPFEVVGAPRLNGTTLAQELSSRHLPGCEFQASQWRPTHGVFQGEMCSGVRLIFTAPTDVSLVRLNFEIMDAIRKTSPGYQLFGRSHSHDQMFDLECGTNDVRRRFLAGDSEEQIWRAWNTNFHFNDSRKPYLLYQ